MNAINPDTSKKWYIVYVNSRAEKKVKAALEAKGIECFIPIQRQLRQWKDRKKIVEVPVLSCYVFVHIEKKDIDRVKFTKNVLQFVAFGREPLIISDSQIEDIEKILLQTEFNVEVTQENFKPGKKVMLTHPSLKGLIGELIQSDGKNQFFIRLKSINLTFAITMAQGTFVFLPEAE